MIKLVGIDLPKDKKILYSLTYVYGIGLKSSARILKLSNINSDRKAFELTSEEISRLRESISRNDLKLEGDLKRFNRLNINRLIAINCYKGRRHKQNLPCHGQRTRTNARSKRGKRQTVVKGKIKLN